MLNKKKYGEPREKRDCGHKRERKGDSLLMTFILAQAFDNGNMK